MKDQSLPTNSAAAALVGYALGNDRTDEEIYTIERLIDFARMTIDPDYYGDEPDERSDAGKRTDGLTSISREWLPRAAAALTQKEWLSLQCLGESPVQDITALRFLSNLRGLALNGNEISNLEPLASCVHLRRLSLNGNPVRDLTPLAACSELEDLNLQDVPVEDLTPLERLPKLQSLGISDGQIPALKKVRELRALHELSLSLNPFDSFQDFPAMPQLRRIHSANVSTLEGLRRFPELENLVNFSGEFSSLEPLQFLKRLTHMNVLESRVSDLTPLRGLFALRRLWLKTSAPRLNLSPLQDLPALHDVTIRCGNQDAAGLDNLRAELPPWDLEFAADVPVNIPAAELQVVADAEFAAMEMESFNVTEADSDRALFRSERDWLADRLAESLALDWEEREDFDISSAPPSKSRTVEIALMGDQSLDAFGRIARAIQEVLSKAKHDWRAAVCAEWMRFEAIIYVTKIVVPAKHAAEARRLLRV